MAVYVLIPGAQSAQIKAKAKQVFPNDTYEVEQSDSILIAANLTTEALAERLGLSGGESGNFLITAVEKYWGWGNKDMWEWIGLKSR